MENIFLQNLLEALEGIDLTDDEQKIIKWLAGWDLYTVANIVTIVEKCRKKN